MTLLLRIGLTPIAFVLVARAQSRFGDWIGGRLIGLPLTTGPFLLTVCMTSSRTTAAHAAAGVTSGQMAVVIFCSAYAWTARQLRPLAATVTSLALAFGAVVVVSSFAGTWSAATAVWIVIAASLVLWPWARHEGRAAGDGVGSQTPGAGSQTPGAESQTPGAGSRAGTVAPPRAALLQRAAISTCVVATMSTLVPILGARPAGIISSAPILLSIMLPGTHRQSGAAGAGAMARGTIVSMTATVAFSAVLASSLPQMPVVAALLLAASVLGGLIAVTPLLERLLSQLSPGPGRAHAPAHP
ncbi:MAG: hypothetical protein KGL15_00875 [Acidobacteriota bacterium]|nr:hypothetical protein [Acidobacteriota bacterium]